MSRLLALLVALVGPSLILAACGGPTGPEDSALLPLDPGIELVRDVNPDLAWSADGTEIYYATHLTVVGSQSSIMAKPVESPSSPERVLVDGGGEPFMGMATSPDGAWLYYVRWPSDSTAAGASLYRVATAGGPERLLALRIVVGSHFGRPERASFVISPDGARLAFAREIDAGGMVDSIVVLDPETGTERSFASHLATEPVSFSPDGQRLMYVDCTTFDECGFSIVDLQTGAVEAGPYQVSGGELGLNFLLGVRWDAEGIRLVVAHYPDIALQDASTGTETKLVMSGNVGFNTTATFAGWSPDGAPAAWKGGCVKAANIFQCGESRGALYLFDRSGHNPQVLAVTTQYGGSAEFSPDGRKVAYLVYYGGAGDGIFLHDVP